MVNSLSKKSITSLTRSGPRDWLVQRVTAVVMAVYVIFLLSFFIGHQGLEFFAWQALFSNLAMRVFSVLFLLCLFWHVWIGMWIITTDYLKPFCVRLSVQTMVILALITYLIWGIAILWSF